MQRLSKGSQKITPFVRLIATTKKVNGVVKKTYTPDNITRFCNFSSYGGTETTVNGVLSVEDTAQVIAWYDPDIKSGDGIELLETGWKYEIIGTPEDIELRHQEMSFKVKRIKGGV